MGEILAKILMAQDSVIFVFRVSRVTSGFQKDDIRNKKGESVQDFRFLQSSLSENRDIHFNNNIDIHFNNNFNPFSLLFEHEEFGNGINKADFRYLLDLATKESLFVFNDQYYKHTDGITMGSSLGPVLANIFLSYYEKKWLQPCPTTFKTSIIYEICR